MFNVNLLYTALSRAREKIYLVGDEKVFLNALNNQKQTQRLTMLGEYLHELSQS
jgi:ATP-dependent exoDNAse (exonuclease V) alpha subunit